MLTVVVGTPNTTTPEAGLPEEPAAITMWGVTAASEAGDTNVGAWTSFDPKTIIQLRIQLLKKSSRTITRNNTYYYPAEICLPYLSEDIRGMSRAVC